MLRRWIIATGAAMAAAVVTVAPANAGVDEFVNEINSQNVDIGMYALQRYNLPLMGTEICNRFRGGMNYDQVLGTYPSLFGDGPRVIRIAQQTICPETIK